MNTPNTQIYEMSLDALLVKRKELMEKLADIKKQLIAIDKCVLLRIYNDNGDIAIDCIKIDYDLIQQFV